MGYGSIILDNWTEINKASVFNVLLRTESNVSAGRRVFFLKCIYTGSKTADSSEHVKLIEDEMEEFGGMARICAITSDNASACLEARLMLTEKRAGVTGVNLQSHVADLLIRDIAEIPWIRYVLRDVATVATELQNGGKLKHRFIELLEDYNRKLKEARHESGLGCIRQRQKDEVRHRDADRTPLNSNEALNDDFNVAFILKQIFVTRSVEDVLECFWRSRFVLRALVREKDFQSSLYEANTDQERWTRTEKFVAAVDSFEDDEAVMAVYSLFRYLRRYRKAFLDKSVRITEVVPFTNQLTRDLESMPLSKSLTEKRKKEILKVFTRRRDGPIDRNIKVRLLEDIHFVSTMLNPN